MRDSPGDDLFSSQTGRSTTAEHPPHGHLGCVPSTAPQQAALPSVMDRGVSEEEQQHLWDTTAPVEATRPATAPEQSPVPWQFAALQWVPGPAPHSWEASGEHPLPRSKHPAAVRTPGFSAQLRSNWLKRGTLQRQQLF